LDSADIGENFILRAHITGHVEFELGGDSGLPRDTHTFDIHVYKWGGLPRIPDPCLPLIVQETALVSLGPAVWTQRPEFQSAKVETIAFFPYNKSGFQYDLSRLEFRLRRGDNMILWPNP
jgi:hypothetical protein